MKPGHKKVSMFRIKIKSKRNADPPSRASHHAANGSLRQGQGLLLFRKSPHALQALTQREKNLSRTKVAPTTKGEDDTHHRQQQQGEGKRKLCPHCSLIQNALLDRGRDRQTKNRAATPRL